MSLSAFSGSSASSRAPARSDGSDHHRERPIETIVSLYPQPVLAPWSGHPCIGAAPSQLRDGLCAGAAQRFVPMPGFAEPGSSHAPAVTRIAGSEPATPRAQRPTEARAAAAASNGEMEAGSVEMRVCRSCLARLRIASALPHTARPPSPRPGPWLIRRRCPCPPATCFGRTASQQRRSAARAGLALSPEHSNRVPWLPRRRVPRTLDSTCPFNASAPNLGRC